MRLWSLHPSYLDRLGLIAVWREGLLAFKVLRNETRGYKHHPQLQRFRNSQYAIDYIILYLWFIYKEAESRNYHFNKTKLGLAIDDQIFFAKYESNKLSVTIKQIEYEFNHLQKKLLIRCKNKAEENMKLIIDEKGILDISKIKIHQIFNIVEGEIEKWERVK